jgi:hypothetical protein
MKLPPFSARGERDRTAMIEWMHGVLDEYYAEHYYDVVLGEAEAECRRQGYSRLELPGAIKVARHGDVQYLRRLYPEITEFVQPARLARGQRHPQPHRLDHVRATAKLVQRIWLAYYKRHRRRASDGPSAREIAAAYHGVDEDAVPWKPGGKHARGSRRRQR